MRDLIERKEGETRVGVTQRPAPMEHEEKIEKGIRDIA